MEVEKAERTKRCKEQKLSREKHGCILYRCEKCNKLFESAPAFRHRRLLEGHKLYVDY